MSEKLEVIHTFNESREKVFEACTQAEHLQEWWGPKGWEFTIPMFDFWPGGTFHYSQKSPEGDKMWVKFVYEDISAPETFTYIQFFSDEEGQVVRAPFHEAWPLKMKNTFTFREHEGKTVLTMTVSPVSATPAEEQTFEESKDMIRDGFSGTFVQLEDYLSNR